MYLALSYVWGHPPAQKYDQTATNTSSRLLPTNGMPRVVEDAIRVVRELGLKYL